MDQRCFDMNLSFPADSRFAETVRDLVVQAASYAGCTVSDARAFGKIVEDVVKTCATTTGATTHAAVPVVLRRDEGPIEVLVGCEQRFQPSIDDHRVTCDWTSVDGRQMCQLRLPVIITAAR